MSLQSTCTDANLRRVLLCFLFASCAWVFSSLTAEAASIETLVMPGPVVEGHKDLETDCNNCHTKFDRQSQRQLCLDCHEDIDADQQAKEGFHGLHSAASQAECAVCHVEHKGRGADITGLVPELFDHSFTDFPLQGQHSSTACADCHVSGKLFRDTSAQCSSCHENDDPHQGNLGDNCASCHAESGWSEISFDHDTETDYPLTGAHVQTPCSSCHVNESYEDTATDCYACHKLDDVHNGTRGVECDSCHSTKNWDADKFDHLQETGFALEGNHAELACANCHLADMKIENPPITCNGCHSTNDPHLGRNGDDCAGCHSQQNWKVNFDHKRETDFALLGSHADLTCIQCHKGALTDPVPTNCADCHQQDDPHAGALGECGNCHGEDKWDRDLQFHHDLTEFSLLGAHRVTACEQCHNGLKFADNDAKQCVDCHRDDDVHKTSMGDDCVTCHSPVDWQRWVFDHDTQTEYPLLGSHDGLVCGACHTPGRKKAPSTNCYSCHQQDDVHRGSFGKNCQRCHTTDNFSEARMGRN